MPLHSPSANTESTAGKNTRTAFFLKFLVTALLLIPTIVWITQDRHPFGGDQSQYAKEAVRLYRTLSESPKDWWVQMVTVIGYKPPGIAWIAQFFVPLGAAIGSIDLIFRMCIVLTHFLGLVLFFSACLKLSKGDGSVAAFGCIVVASAPLFVGASHEFMNEPSQFFVVAYFVYIMASARNWDRALVLSHLLLGSALATLAKTTTPLFCFMPGLFALGFVFKRNQAWGWHRRGTWIVLATALFLTACAVVWYSQNLPAVRAFVAGSTVGPHAEYWGRKDTYWNSLLFWMGSAQRAFLTAPAVIAGAGMVIAGLIKGRTKRDYFTACACIAALQIAAIFIVFATQMNRSQRFLLPSLPYLSLLLCWCIVVIRSRAVTCAVIVLFLFQSVIVHLNAWGVKWYPIQTVFLRPVHASRLENNLLGEIVSKTCSPPFRDGRINIVAIDAGLKGDWLGPQGADYFASKMSLMNQRELPCQYLYVSGRYFGSDSAYTWKHTINSKADYVITANPQIYPPKPTAFSQSLLPENFLAYLHKLKSSGIFEREALLNDPGILIFHRANQQKFMIELAEVGDYRVAIEELSHGTTMDPNNFEAWFYLASVYEKAGRFTRARRVANHALKLFSAEDTANMPRRVALLSILVRVNLREKKINQACRGLSEISRLEPAASILSKLEALNCSAITLQRR